MDDEEDIDIAAAMGFGSFGGTKKRKYDHTTSPQAADGASGANTTQLGARTRKSESTQNEVQGDSEAQKSEHCVAAEPSAHSTDVFSAPRDRSRDDAAALETVSFGGPPITRGELNALKFGVRNPNGDMAYFLPNFVEDPWARLTQAGT